MELNIGRFPHGSRNLISDVPGVRVGHATVDCGECHTGVTVILPPKKNPFMQKMTAASQVFNGFGKSAGLVQVDELGTIETPIALTNTLNVGKVHDAMVSWILDVNEAEGNTVTSVNPVVCECNDSRINRISLRPVGKEEVYAAISSASEDFAEGSVGAGRGTVCYGMKGGIGSSSRVITLGEESFTIGVLVQSNYGAGSDFNRAEVKNSISECDVGSIIIIVATDLPVSCRQLKRIIRRCSVGMARLGSYIGHGSGEIAVGFSTAAPVSETEHFALRRTLREEDMNLPFRAVGEATEEAILKSLLQSGSDVTLDGKKVRSLKEELGIEQK